MLELLAIFGLLLAGVAVFAVLALAWGLLKLVFKLLLLPLVLAWGLFKLLLFCGLLLVVLLLAPALVALLLVALPFLVLAGVVGLGWAIVS